MLGQTLGNTKLAHTEFTLSPVLSSTVGSFKQRRFASFFTSRLKRIKTRRKVAEQRELLTYSIDQATFASPTFVNEVKNFRT